MQNKIKKTGHLGWEGLDVSVFVYCNLMNTLDVNALEVNALVVNALEVSVNPVFGNGNAGIGKGCHFSSDGLDGFRDLGQAVLNENILV